MATQAAASTWRRVYADPEATTAAGEYEDRRQAYLYRWAWYENSIFDVLNRSTWAQYKADYRLYRHTRAIYNPARRLGDFYGAILWPGILSADGDPPPGGQLGIPLPEDTPAELRQALGQIWQWSNLQKIKSLIGRYGSILGDVGIEIIDDPDSRKITIAPIWPGHIVDLELDREGNAQAYTLEYQALDREKDQSYTYRKTVTKDWIATWRDDAPYSYDGLPPEYANPYGFCPFVWIKHTDTGGDHGLPAMRNLLAWEELNGLASHDLDHAHKILKAPVILSGSGIAGTDLTGTKAGSSHDQAAADSSQESIDLLKTGPGVEAKALSLEPGEAIERIDRILAQIERDHPELTLWEKLRDTTQISGVAADRLIGDAKIYVDDARANYDAGLIAANQMAIAIGGWRANSGAWGSNLDRQRQALIPFSLDSYAAGDLDFEIMPRPLFPPSPMEQIQEERARLALDRDQTVRATPGLIDRETPDAIARRLQEANA